MKKILLLFTLLCNLVASNQIQKITLVDNNFTIMEKKYILNNTVTIGMMVHNYPFSYEENGTVSGFSYDYLNLIMKKSGLKINIEMDNWTNTLNKFKNKKINLIDFITFKNNRESFTNFTKPYFEIPNVIFARKGELNNYLGFESLKGKKIGITNDIYYYDSIKSLGLFELIEFIKPENKMKALAYGQVDAVFHNLISGQKHIKKEGFSNIKILDELDGSIVKKEDLRIGVIKEDKVLFSIISKSIEAITKEEKERLLNKWFAAKSEINVISNNINLTNEETNYLKEKRQITMCIDPTWMPFEKLNKNGTHVGMTAEYFDIFKKKLNVDIKVIKTKRWNESLENAKSRKCDILSLAMETPDRKKYLNFTTPYLRIPIVIATKMNVPFINNMEAIKHKSVGITKGYAFIELLRNKYKNLDIVEVENIDEGLIKVNKGELFGYIGTLATISHQFQSGLRGELKIAGKLEESWALGIGVRNDDKILFNILEKVVKSIDSQKQQKILNNWISIKYEKNTDYSYIWQILLFVLIITLLILYRQYILKKSNDNLHRLVENKTKDLQTLNENLAIKIKEEVEKNLDIQEQLFKSEKMASMGEMIGNISHQWRQPLSVISTAATGIIMQKEFDLLDDTKLIETCTTINDNAQYLSKTIDDFKNFIKGDRIKKMFNLKDNINSFFHLVEGSVKNNDIYVIQNLDEEININGYENELLQCFVNIFNNAKDALNDNIMSNNKMIFITTSLENEKAIIKIKDNAHGIPENILPKIFEPYFTTKNKSQGTGLGLHMTYSLIVDGMRGTIEAKNISYEYQEKTFTGAEFTIILPIS